MPNPIVPGRVDPVDDDFGRIRPEPCDGPPASASAQRPIHGPVLTPLKHLSWGHIRMTGRGRGQLVGFFHTAARPPPMSTGHRRAEPDQALPRWRNRGSFASEDPAGPVLR
jgi:hypothetical protein